MKRPTAPVLSRAAVIGCGALLMGFAVVAWAATCTKNATFDEPHHAVGAWVQLWHGDYRVDPQNGALWHDLLALATPPASLQANFQDADFVRTPEQQLRQYRWVVDTLYRTAGNHAEAFVQHQRATMLVLSVVLGVLTAGWAARLGGPIAAVVATALFCCDPNLLAHAALVKNDLAFALVILGGVMLTQSMGLRLTVCKTVLLGLILGAATTVKSSGLVLLPLSAGLLLFRALLPRPWWAPGGQRERWWMRVGSVLVVAAAVSGIAYVSIWAVYRFRFAPTPDPHVLLADAPTVRLAAESELMLRLGTFHVTPQQVAAAPLSGAVRSILWVESHRLLPQAFCNGLLYQYQANLLRNTFFCGRVSFVGSWSYFPLAMLWKTPVATLILVGFAAVLGALTAVLPRPVSPGEIPGDGFSVAWFAACVVVPPLLLLAGAMASNVNVGIRHILVIYPFVFVAVGCVAATAWERWPRLRQLGAGMFLALLVASVCETAMSFPDYIDFFNAAVGGPRQGIRLLGDSNLDWGQDLKLLADWQRAHPTVRLYLSYFGFADPAYYGIHYINLPDGYAYGPAFQWPTAPGVIAISASNLQGFNLPPALYDSFYRQFAQLPPLQVLGGTIYLFPFDGHLQRTQVPLK